ncbi:MAG TPA: hypothetical protein V6D05_07680, partial [Stenomitos sp.]
ANFYGAIYAFGFGLGSTMLISRLTAPRPDSELVGLVYSLTPRPDSTGTVWYRRPAVLGGVVLAFTVALNVLFR